MHVTKGDRKSFVEGRAGGLDGFVAIRQDGRSFRLDALMEVRLPDGVLYGRARRDDGDLHSGEGQLRLIGAEGSFAGIEANCAYTVMQGETLHIVHECAWHRPSRK